MSFYYPLSEWVITSPFGNRIHPISHIEKFHNGIDLSAPVGTPIYAPEDSTVIKSYSNSVGGKQIILEHPEGYKTGYAHLSDTLFNVGDKLKRGDIFAYTGNTGASTGAHLHFTVRKNDQFIDPESIMFSTSKKKTLIALGILVIVISAYLLFLKR